MASLIEELIAKQSQRQTPQAVQSDIGGMLGMLSQGMNAGQSNLNVASVLNNQAPVAQAAPLPAMGNMGSGIGKTLISSMLGDYMDEKKLEKATKIDTENNAKTTAYLDKLPQGATPIERAMYMAKGPTGEVRKMGIENLGAITKAEGKPWSENATAEMKNIMAEGIQPGTPEFNQRMSEVNNRYKEITPYQQAQLEQSRQSGDLQNTKLQLELERNAIMDNRAMTQQERQAKLDENSQKQQVFNQANTLRDEFNNSIATKNYQTVQPNIGTINTVWKDPSKTNAAGDMAGIFAYMKMLDPNSTVREGEYAKAEQTAGIPTYVSNLYNKALTGENLSEGQRRNFMEAANKMNSNFTKELDKNISRYKNIAQRNNINIKDVTQGFGPPIPDHYETWNEFKAAQDSYFEGGKK